MWGFHGPLGAFVTAWGGIAMLVSAPFDDWWHNAYGLDVKILSPPHTVLAAGILAIEIGALMLVLGYMNRAQGDERRRLSWLYLYLGSMIVVVLQILTMEHTGRVLQHTAWFYISVAIAVPTSLIGVAIASDRRWSATIVASVYMLFTASLIWILPLFPARTQAGSGVESGNAVHPAGVSAAVDRTGHCHRSAAAASCVDGIGGFRQACWARCSSWFFLPCNGPSRIF